MLEAKKPMASGLKASQAAPRGAKRSKPNSRNKARLRSGERGRGERPTSDAAGQKTSGQSESQERGQRPRGHPRPRSRRPTPRPRTERSFDRERDTHTPPGRERSDRRGGERSGGGQGQNNGSDRPFRRHREQRSRRAGAARGAEAPCRSGPKACFVYRARRLSGLDGRERRDTAGRAKSRERKRLPEAGRTSTSVSRTMSLGHPARRERSERRVGWGTRHGASVASAELVGAPGTARA